MIDPNNWRGPLTHENAEEIALAFRERLASGKFDFLLVSTYGKQTPSVLERVLVYPNRIIIENRDQILAMFFSETREIRFEPERIVVLWNNDREDKEWRFFPKN